MNKSFLILPGCDDRNRGDQALIWETVNLAKAAGYDGQFFMLSSGSASSQSKKIGIKDVNPILEHPSTRFKASNNISYNFKLKIKWGIVSIWDIITKELLVHRFLRRIIKKLQNNKVLESLNIFEDVNACFVKGGGFLHAYGGLADTYKIYYFLYHIRLALSLGKDVYVMPNSFGPFKSPFVKTMIRKTLSKCKVVMSREKISQEQLKKECSIDSYLFTDIAFHIKQDDSFDAKRELKEKGIPIGEKKCVAITARPYRFTGFDNPDELYKKYQESLISFIEWLSQNGYFPVLVEHVYDNKAHEDDMTCILDIVKHLSKECNYGVFSDRSLSCKQLKKIYGEFDYIVGTRFHSVIFSLAQEVPAIAITYGGNKGVGIMNDLGLENYAIPIESITREKIIEKFCDLSNNVKRNKAKIRDNLVLIQKEKEQIIKLLSEE